MQIMFPFPADVFSFSQGLKLLYRFSRKESLNIYLYGLAGQFRIFQGNMDDIERLIGYSAGIGVEYSTQNLPDDIKNTFELGYLKIPDTDVDTTFQMFLAYGLRIYF